MGLARETTNGNLAVGIRSEYFLATTALEEFWDTSKPIVFLGGWCKKYSRKLLQQFVEVETLPLPYTDEETTKIFHYLNGLCERLLTELAQGLNNIHGVSHSTRYWKILIGPWLHFYAHVLYDRYLTIQMAIKRYPELTTICLDESCFVVPSDTLDFMKLTKEDAYNLQIYSKIIKFMGKRYPTKDFPVRSVKQDSQNLLSLFLLKLKDLTKYLFHEVFPIFYNNRMIIFKSSYFPRNIEIRLITKTNGIFWPYFDKPADAKTLPVNLPARTMLAEVVSGQNDFECLLAKLIAEDMPQSFMERYKAITKDTSKSERQRPAAIFSAVSWHFDDIFKEWAAKSAEKGTYLVGTQHGGNYGSQLYFLQEKHELSVVDRFYSWGWSRENVFAEVIPFPATKLAGRKTVHSPKGEENGEILYVTNAVPRYLVQFPMTYEYGADYIKKQSEFYLSLSANVKARIKLRPHREDRGWDVIGRFKDFNKNIKIESWDIPFLTSLVRCHFFICDHPLDSTTFIEALTINKPTILFFNPSFAANRLNPFAVEYYDDLRSVGILFDSPLDTAEQVNLIYEYIDEWWNEKKRQEVVGRFINMFGKVSANTVDEWSKELHDINNSHQDHGRPRMA